MDSEAIKEWRKNPENVLTFEDMRHETQNVFEVSLNS
jgi:hypothetical protein